MRRTLILAAAVAACAVNQPRAFGAQPTFFARREYVGYGQLWVADVNGDKIPDVLSYSAGDAATLLGNGNGTFRAGPSSNVGVVGVAAAADLNGDGLLDLVVAGQPYPSETWGVGVSLASPGGTFQPAVFYPTGADSQLGSVVLGDFNGDGITDAVAVAEDGLWFFPGKGGGTLGSGVLTPLSGLGLYMVAADLNGDGSLDLAVVTANGFDIILGNGNGTFQPPQAVSTAPYFGAWIAVGDLTSGHHADIALVPAAVSGEEPNEVYVYLSNGKGGFSGPSKVPIPGIGQIMIGDVNGDHIPDLVSSLGCIALSNGNGTFKPPLCYPVPNTGYVSQGVLGDLLNNNSTDIVVSDGTGNISVLLNIGGAKYEDGLWTGVAAGAGCGAAADYNGDGKPDLAVNGPGGVTILLGTGSAAPPFETGSAIPLANADCLVTGDLNGDGIPDLLIPVNDPPPATGGTIYAYLGNGDGTFTQASATPTAAGGFVTLGDFNHDGKLDFATSGNLLALGNGDGTFQTPAPIVAQPPYGGFTNIAAADLNGDGWTDLVITASFESYIYILLNNHQGGFGVTTILSEIGRALFSPAQVVLADLSRGGPRDIVVSSSYGGAAIYLNDGTGSFTYEEEFSAMGEAGVLAVSDINGDGIPDLVMTESSTIAILLGKGNATFAAPYYIGAGRSPGDLPLENLHGQAASADLPDVVVPDVTGGVMVLINTTP